MATTSMNIRIDKEVKVRAQKLFSDLGLDMTTAVNLFLRQAIIHNGIPFELKLREENPENLLHIEGNGKNDAQDLT